ncbi:uncharacterized protein LOC103709575 isoform X1 [Phoenix dactylifera]|uniref:Dolichyl-diphosphooligosaccharide-protein glycosyltransferase subunit OST5 n=1 Tax=Phoenix dactylifera TaxID=42345 RepID=A0A8B9AJ43_PHODC|nr:uncharacterized protein LOC103709575 isoform X1 [Phoenix dactylifera]
MASKPISSPVPVAWYPSLAVLMLSIGLVVTASFFMSNVSPPCMASVLLASWNRGNCHRWSLNWTYQNKYSPPYREGNLPLSGLITEFRDNFKFCRNILQNPRHLLHLLVSKRSNFFMIHVMAQLFP